MRHDKPGGRDDRRAPGHGDPHRCRPPGFGGRGGPGRRYFGRGDVKYALLELLALEPMHGYQMMKALEEKSDGQYTPSAGSIYPTLQMLEDRSWIEADEADGKKVYRSTEAGAEALAEWQERVRQERSAEADECAVSPRERWLADSFELLRLLTKAERRASCDAGYAQRFQQYLDGALRDLRLLLSDRRGEDRDGQHKDGRHGDGHDDDKQTDDVSDSKKREREQ